MATRLTDRGIAALRPTDRSVLYFDTEVNGLAVRVYPSGIKSFIFDWRGGGRQRRVTLGSPPVWTIGKARLAAGKLRLKADTGESVAPGRGERVGDLIETWREIVRLTRRPNTIKAYSRLIDAHILPAFGKVDPRTIGRNAIEHWHAGIAQTTAVEANRALAVLSAFFGWLEHDRKIERNPCKGVKRRPEAARHIFLSQAEIETTHVSLDIEGSPAALALKVALLTGARIGEVLTLSPDQIDANRRVWAKPSHLTKQKRISVIPLQDEAVVAIEALLALGLPDYNKCVRLWRRVRVAIGRVDATVHDLRHSRASSLARNGASLPQIGRLLGHASPSTTNKYVHLVDADLVDLVERSR